LRHWNHFPSVREGSCRTRRRVSGPGRRAGLVLLGDPPSLDEDDTDPHCCARPLDAVAVPSPAAAPAYLATAAGGLLFGANGVAAAGVWVSNPTTHRQDASRQPRPPRSPRQFQLRSRTVPCPVAPREPSDRLARPPRCRVWMLPRRPSGQRASRQSAPVRSAERRGESVPDCRCISPATPEWASIPDAALGRRHPALNAPPTAGFPPAVRSPGLPESPPDTPHKGGVKDGATIPSAPKRHQRRVLSTLRRHCALAPFRALSLPTSPPCASVPR